MFVLRVDEEIVLGLLEERLAPVLFGLVEENRVYLREWLPWVDVTRSIADQRAFIHSARQQFASNAGVQTGIWYRGTLVGVIGLHQVDWANRSTSIGYWLAAPAQGRGIMTRSCATMLDYAFGELGLNRVEIRCGEGNLRSRAIPERLGFQTEGLIRDAERLSDHYVNHFVYGMLAREWHDIRQSRIAGLVG